MGSPSRRRVDPGLRGLWHSYAVHAHHGRRHEGGTTRAAANEFGIEQGGRHRPAHPPGVDRGGR
eukprot:12663954-Heterocapsa_arctica.AAC.1